MAYLSKNHRNNSNTNNNEQPYNNINNNKPPFYSSTVKKNGYNNNGYKAVNNYNQTNNADLQNRLKLVQEKQKKESAKKAIKAAATSVNPLLGLASDAAMNTAKGKRVLDAYAKGDSPAESFNNARKQIRKEKNRTKIILLILSWLAPIILLIFFLILVTSLFKNADSQIYSNENGGTVDSEYYQLTEEEKNIFKGYPGLYEKITKKSKEISNKYKLEIDRFLIIATLVAPIENGLIQPVEDGSCGEQECYYFKGESKTWGEFLDLWGDQSELLAKMQILTFVNQESAKSKGLTCGKEETMEQFAKNDLEVREHYFLWWINPINWFSTFRTAVDAELNARCTEAPNGKTIVPDVPTLSTSQGIYYLSYDENQEEVFEKDPNSGGVYFWNLVNPKGFIHEYLKDYLSNEYSNDVDKNYEENKEKIVEITNYIYAYYESIRKDCEEHKIIESTIEDITVYNPPEKQARYNVPEMQTINFEDQYIGGVMLAEYNSGGEEALKAFAILARTEAVAVVGLDGAKPIENSSNVQNYNPNYSPEKYPKIAKAVEETRGIVVGKFESPEIWHTEYDAFCPVKNVLEDGFYYLDDEQQNLPINPGAYEAVAHKQFISPDSKYLECPCFQNNHSRPHDPDAEDENTRYYHSNVEPPTYPGGTPSQETKPGCWKLKGNTRVNEDNETEYAWKYKPTGGHGRGASQYGLTYFDAFEYSQDALIRLFFKSANMRMLSSSLPEGKCDKIPYYEGEITSASGSSGESNYNDVVGGTPLNMSLKEALAKEGHTISDLNNCIGTRAENAGMGTREAVVEAGMGLLECTMNLTGGYTYPYDHRGGYIGEGLNPDIIGKMGVNSKWGEFADYATGCSGGGPCRLGLNCANYVRWSMCNGGMDLCSRGSTFATGMAGVNSNEDYFPGAIRVRLSPSFAVLSGSLSGASRESVIGMIKPGDVLYSDHGGSGNHVMLIVGTDSNSITIAENGRKTRNIAHSELVSGNMTYVVLLLDDYYANESNKNHLSYPNVG